MQVPWIQALLMKGCAPSDAAGGRGEYRPGKCNVAAFCTFVFVGDRARCRPTLPPLEGGPGL